MAELKDSAAQFARDLMAQNIGGLMMVFTPNGMSQAMALQAQRSAAGAQPPATSFEVVVQGQEGDDHLVDIVMKGDGGDATIATRWKDVAGSWKVDGIVAKA